MDFLTFFLYYTGSMFIYEFVRVVGVTIYARYRQNQLHKFAKQNKIQMISMQELMEQLQQQPSGEDKKRWN